MEKDNFDLEKIIEEIEEAGLDVPKIRCRICGKEKPAHTVYFLPEVWRYMRRMSLYMLGKAPEPEPVNEQAMLKKYGYMTHDLFCVDCWLDLVVDGFQKGKPKILLFRK